MKVAMVESSNFCGYQNFERYSFKNIFQNFQYSQFKKLFVFLSENIQGLRAVVSWSYGMLFYLWSSRGSRRGSSCLPG